MSEIQKVPKKRGRKPKKMQDLSSCNIDEAKSVIKQPKKRGRKPKGGKIIVNAAPAADVLVPEPNIILHLKCGVADLNKSFLSSTSDH